MAIALADWEVIHFESRIGEIFAVRGAAAPAETGIELELLTVTRLAPPPAGQPATLRAQPFELLFRAVDRKTLPDGLARFIHGEFGPDELFLGRIMPPAGMDRDQVYYEAIFS